MTLSPRTQRIVTALEGINDGVPAAGVYADDVVFRDPLHTCVGKAALDAMTQQYIERARSIHFEIDRGSILESDDRIYFTWVGTFAGRIGPKVRVEGATLLLLRDDLITEHRDYFDVLGAVLGSLPGVGAVYGRLTGLAG